MICPRRTWWWPFHRWVWYAGPRPPYAAQTTIAEDSLPAQGVPPLRQGGGRARSTGRRVSKPPLPDVHELASSYWRNTFALDEEVMRRSSARSVLFAPYGRKDILVSAATAGRGGDIMTYEEAKKLLAKKHPRMWDCIAVACPSCDASVGQRCKPLGPPYKTRSTRLEVDAPHVMRFRSWNLTRRTFPGAYKPVCIVDKE